MKTENIFKHIKPNANDLFNNLNGYDLQELLYYIENYYLDYRIHLGLPEDVTFGMELELSHSKNKLIKNELKQIRPIWETVPDASLLHGIELTSPILTDTIETWKNVEKVCSIASKYSTIDSSCGGHIHVGVQTLGGELQSWLNFIMLWSVYENVIYRFVYGSYLTGREGISKYAEPIAEDFRKYYEWHKDSNIDLKHFIALLSNFNRRQGINFLNVESADKFESGNTIEFRCPNGSLEPVIWQNNVNLFTKMLLYSKSKNFNKDVIEKRKHIVKIMDIEWYSEIYLDQALEFCDLIFDNNLDKIYFLRQYLKSFEVGSKRLEKAKTFIKKG